MIRKIIRSFCFETKKRSSLTFSDKTKVRLNGDNPLDPVIQLKQQVDESYPIDTDLTIQTWTMNPHALKRWIEFEAVEVLPSNTSIGYKVLVNGGNPYFWNGSAWAAAGATDWSTSDQVRDNISTLPLTATDLAFIINPRSSDGLATPTLSAIKLCGEFDIEFFDDILYGTLVRDLQENLHVTTVLEIEVASSTSSINLATDYRPENSGYNFTDIESVYNLSTDPNKMINVASGYTPGAAKPDGSFEYGSVGLSVSVSTGDILQLTLVHTPEVAVFTSQDYYELARFPILVLENIRTTRPREGNTQEINQGIYESVKNKALGTGYLMYPPRQTTIEVDFMIAAKSQIDFTRLVDGFTRWSDKRILKTWGLWDDVVMLTVNEFDTNNSIDASDIRSVSGTLRLISVPFYQEAVSEYLIQNFNVTYTKL